MLKLENNALYFTQQPIIIKYSTKLIFTLLKILKNFRHFYNNVYIYNI